MSESLVCKSAVVTAVNKWDGWSSGRARDERERNSLESNLYRYSENLLFFQPLPMQPIELPTRRTALAEEALTSALQGAQPCRL
jgi:hypothetical protein